MLGLADKDIYTVIISIFNLFKKQKHGRNQKDRKHISRDENHNI